MYQWYRGVLRVPLHLSILRIAMMLEKQETINLLLLEKDEREETRWEMLKKSMTMIYDIQ